MSTDPVTTPSGLHPAARLASRLLQLDAAQACLTDASESLKATVHRIHPLLVSVRREGRMVLLAPAQVWDRGRELLEPYVQALSAYEARLLLLGTPERADLQQLLHRGIGALLRADATADELVVAVHQALELLEVKARSESRGQWVNRYRYELGELIDIAKAMTQEKEPDRLLGVILEKSRFITGADAGSIYVVEGRDAELAGRSLRFKLSQNDSVSFDSREFSMPISPRSLAGYVALEKRPVRIEDAYAMPAGSPFAFDPSFDRKVGYRTRSMLCTPLMSSQGEVIGVLQLINKKRDSSVRLLEPPDFEHLVVPFDDRSSELMATLAAQAGIALENALLYGEIRQLFEGFVRASVDAIEARDPTTSGHSRRVAELTVELAKVVEATDEGPYREVQWKREDLREIEYASLLHDFGKIGVREHVLVKAKKLYPHEFEQIRMRFDFAMRSAQADIAQRKLHAMMRGASLNDLEALDLEYADELAALEDAWQVIVQSNEPTVMAAGDFVRLEGLMRRTYPTLEGSHAQLLKESEVRSLSVPRGSLTATEFDEIRGHVSHTFRFLSRIPWGRAFARVPTIAGAHHERLNGTGYPNRLRAEEIPLQSKMMSISDIFDALTASDRPYKRAVPLERALDILAMEVKDGHIDGELLRLFIAGRAWRGVIPS
jgi:HD-GYP domain-containing protein (c-di-GMP phosphodiesterase class II)